MKQPPAHVVAEIAKLGAAWPSWDCSPATVAVYAEDLADIPAPLLAAGCRALRHTGGSFAPSIGQIRSAALEAQKELRAHLLKPFERRYGRNSRSRMDRALHYLRSEVETERAVAEAYLRELGLTADEASVALVGFARQAAELALDWEPRSPYLPPAGDLHALPPASDETRNDPSQRA